MQTSDERREQLRTTFTEDAELYDRMRPNYPAVVFAALADFGHLVSGSRVLEIGCGTGQATRPLAERGYNVTAIELGPEMAAVARRNLSGFPNATVIQSAFEAWPLPAEPFDAVMSATAFHWLDPAVRVRKCADALRPGGTLAIIRTEHILGGDVDFFNEVQDCYERWDPATPPGLRLQPGEAIPVDTDELDSSGAFEPAIVERYPWPETYMSSEYRDVLLTYSGHRALRSDWRQGLLDCITDILDNRYGGRITKQYMAAVSFSRRHSHA